ncbi:MAG: polyprenyl synthetase family protein [Thermoprotei archaeon]
MDGERAAEAVLPDDVYAALGDVKKRISSLISKKRPTLFPAAAHLVKNGGKLVRPSLVLLSCAALGGDPKKAEPAAAAVEMIHVASLIQDDLMDGDRERRGVEAVHTLYGTNEAILASDLLIQLAVSEANLLGKRVVAELARAAKLLAQGQDLDLKYRRRKISAASYLRVARLKTGVLMGCCMAEGAIVAGADLRTVRAMRLAGELFGVAFQMHDDSLDWEAGERAASNAVAVFGGEEGVRLAKEEFMEKAEAALSSARPSFPFKQLFRASLVGIATRGS